MRAYIHKLLIYRFKLLVKLTLCCPWKDISREKLRHNPAQLLFIANEKLHEIINSFFPFETRYSKFI